MTGVLDLWPAAGLRVRSGDLELRWMDDLLLPQVADLAGRGIHDPDAMPFYVPWTRGSALEVTRSVLTYQWGVRGAVGPERLVVELAVLHHGQPVGVQGASGDDFGTLRSVETGSWLGREFQGRGIGTRMRVLMLHLLFAGLEATEVTSGAFADNAASNAVSRRVGYEANGISMKVREGKPAEHVSYRMTRERWGSLAAQHARILGAEVSIDGDAKVREQLGL